MPMRKRELLKSDTFCIRAQDCFENKSWGLANGFPQIMRSILKMIFLQTIIGRIGLWVISLEFDNFSYVICLFTGHAQPDRIPGPCFR